MNFSNQLYDISFDVISQTQKACFLNELSSWIEVLLNTANPAVNPIKPNPAEKYWFELRVVLNHSISQQISHVHIEHVIDYHMFCSPFMLCNMFNVN